MVRPKAKSFTAVLEPLRNGLGWLIARVPFDVEKAWPVRNRLRVRGEIEGFEFRTSLFAMEKGGRHFLLVNKKMQKAARVSLGSAARIKLEPDLEERKTEIPAELAKELKGDKRLSRWFSTLPPSGQRWIGNWVGEPKSVETRQRRAEKMAERLYLTMEGEREPPPILRAIFQRQPAAAPAWQALTPVQRRNHLLGIFYCERVEARERRAAKAIEEALRVARRIS